MRKRLLITLFMTFSLALTAFGYNQFPGKGITAKPGRATWDTEFFQEALVRRGLGELGYTVERPKDLQNPIFYQSLVLGDLDYWANGWFPLHNEQLPRDFEQKASIVGHILKAGGLQGYLVSKKAVEQYNIKSLDDFKRPEVIKAFDHNNDGKADMVACPPGWGCEKVITHHMKVYDMHSYINPIKASYSASMAEALALHRSGKPVFFYTWAPNWTIFKLKPDEDVMWINVPSIQPNEGQAASRDLMTVANVKRAVSDPIDLGFVVNDIRIVANNDFLAANPAARKFFEVFELDLVEINAQNTLMQDGEKSQRDIERHVDEWIGKNREIWAGWLAAARKAAN